MSNTESHAKRRVRGALRLAFLCLLGVLYRVSLPEWIGSDALHAAQPPGVASLPGADQRLAARVAVLLRGLSSSSRKDRVQAENELASFGAAALPLLPAPELLPGVAAQDAVRRVRVRIENDMAEASVRATRVKLHGTLSMTAALEQLETQSGNTLRLDQTLAASSEISKLKFEFEGPWWDAVTLLQARSPGLVVEIETPGVETNQLPAASLQLRRLIPSEELPRRPLGRTSAGPFRIEVEGLERKPLDASQVSNGSQAVLVRCALRVLIEPRLRPLILRCRADDFALTTSAGRLTAFNPGASLELPIGAGQRDIRFPMDFIEPRPPVAADSKAAPTATSASARLTGQFTMLVAAAEERLWFPPLSESEGVARRRGGVTVLIQKVSFEDGSPRTGRTARVQTRISFDATSRAFESHQLWVLHNQVRLTGIEGLSLVPTAMETLEQADSTIRLEYHFRAPEGAANEAGETLRELRFEYLAPTLLADVPGPFDLTFEEPASALP